LSPSTKIQDGRVKPWLTGSQLIARRPEWVLAAAISLAAVFLHAAFLINAGGLWRDEVNTVNLAARGNLGQMAKDSFPVQMPLLMRGWLALGWSGTDLNLRLLGMLIGLGILAALWLAAWIVKSSPPVLGLALFGLNATVITYGDSLRPFGLGTLWVVLLLAAMWALVRKPSWRRTAVCAAAAALSVQALFQNALFVAATALGGWVVCWRRGAWPAAAKILLVSLLAAASLFPYWSNVAHLATASATSGVSTLRTHFHSDAALASLASASGFPFPSYFWVWGLLALTIMVFGGTAWRTSSAAPESHGKIEDSDAPVFCAMTLLIALGGFAGFLWWAALRTQPWYFLPLLGLAATCIELGLPTLRRYLRGAVLLFLTLTACLAVPAAWHAVHVRFTNVDEVARRLNAEAAPEDFVLVIPWNRGISFARYFRARTPWETVPPLSDHTTHRYDLLQQQTKAKGVMRPVFEQITAALQTGHRVWLVGTVDIPNAAASVPEDLDPPPRKYTGWSAGPYVRQWTEQVAQFLRNHSRQIEGKPLAGNQPINANEELQLWVAAGWASP
jgi:hypothetical protein